MLRRRMHVVLLGILSSLALVVTPAHATPSPVTGNATYFSGLGSPYGGCGLPQAQLDTQDFLALNVFNTPGNYGWYPRPVPPSMSNTLGSFDNGLNCGRYVQVTIGDYCTGTNDGAPGEPFCRNGSWVPDKYSGATLTMVVADSCADANAWCRDDPEHVDLAQNSLNQFLQGATTVGDMYPNHWNNRQVSWQFVPAPGYTGDIKIGFISSAQPYWPAIAISHLPNGIHGVQYYSNGAWQSAAMDSDMGEDYIIGPTTTSPSQGTQYQIRITDASDTPLDGGRTYQFSLPSSCAYGCPSAYTPANYTVNVS